MGQGSWGEPERVPDAEPIRTDRFQCGLVEVWPDEEVGANDGRVEGRVVSVADREGTPLPACAQTAQA